MLEPNSSQRQAVPHRSDNGGPGVSTTLLTIVGDGAKLEGKFDITGSIEIEWEVSGQLKVSGKLVIGERGAVRADVETVDAIIQGQYGGNMVATGNVEITATGRVNGNIETDSLVISKGGFFNGKVLNIKDNVVKVKDRQDEVRTSSKSRASRVKAPFEVSDQGS